MEKRKKDVLAIIIFFLAGMLSLRVLPDSISTHILGIKFIIASVYGVVAVNKNAPFIFR